MATTFTYKGRDGTGKLVSGQLEADTATLVAARLRSMGYVPFAIEREGKTRFEREIRIPGLTDRISLKDVAVFSRQFATMISSGLTLLRALSVLADQTENRHLAAVVGEIRADVERGQALSAALARHPRVFPPIYIAMVRSGETGGSMDTVLGRLADTLEKQVDLRRKVKSAMTYPVVVGLIVVVILVAMLLFVVPMFEGMFADLGSELPAPTRALLALSAAFTRFWYLGTGLVAGIFFAARRWAATPDGRRRLDAWKLRAPVLGPLVRRTALARFSRSLAALVRAGVPILEALDIVSQTAGNAVVAEAVVQTRQAVKRGESLSGPLATHAVFPPLVTQMMAVGEETGALDDMLDKIADFYDSEVGAAVATLTSLLEPLLVVVMGTTVGGIVVALYMPMFNIIGKMDGSG